MVATVRRYLVLLLVVFFLYWALSQPTQFAEAVATLVSRIGDMLSAVGQVFDALVRRLT